MLPCRLILASGICMQFTRRVQHCTAEKNVQRNVDVEVQQYITIREILTPSPEISTELLHQSDLLFEDELLTIYSKSKVPTL